MNEYNALPQQPLSRNFVRVDVPKRTAVHEKNALLHLRGPRVPISTCSILTYYIIRTRLNALARMQSRDRVSYSISYMLFGYIYQHE